MCFRQWLYVNICMYLRHIRVHTHVLVLLEQYPDCTVSLFSLLCATFHHGNRKASSNPKGAGPIETIELARRRKHKRQISRVYDR